MLSDLDFLVVGETKSNLWEDVGNSAAGMEGLGGATSTSKPDLREVRSTPYSVLRTAFSDLKKSDRPCRPNALNYLRFVAVHLSRWKQGTMGLGCVATRACIVQIVTCSRSDDE
jgi:hypothetical protein